MTTILKCSRSSVTKNNESKVFLTVSRTLISGSSLVQLMPFRNLLSRAVHHFTPMYAFLSRCFRSSNFQSPNDLVLGHSIPIQEKEFQTDVLEAFVVTRNIEQEGLIEHRVQGAFLHMRLLLRNALSVEEQIDLHIGIWRQGATFEKIRDCGIII